MCKRMSCVCKRTLCGPRVGRKGPVELCDLSRVARVFYGLKLHVYGDFTSFDKGPDSSGSVRLVICSVQRWVFVGSLFFSIELCFDGG